LRCDHPIRQAAGRARIDRGDALYLADGPREGFLCEMRGKFFALTPGEALTEAFSEWARPLAEADGLARSLLKLEGVGEGERELLIEGIKLIDLGAREPTLAACERRVRQRAAVCLRKKSGGGLLWLCAACLAQARQGLTKQ